MFWIPRLERPSRRPADALPAGASRRRCASAPAGRTDASAMPDASAPPGRSPPSAPCAAAEEERDFRPVVGWFDSSHDLSRGLLITEHEQPDEVARLVPLGWWLAWALDDTTPPIR